MRYKQFLLWSSIIQLILFLFLAQWASKQKQQPAVEVQIIRSLQQYQSRWLHYGAMSMGRVIGAAGILNILVAPIAALLWKRRFRLEAVILMITCWSHELVKQVVKRVINRPRPSPLLVKTTKRKRHKSFPSGHVSTSVCFWGWLLALGMLSKKGSSLLYRVLFSIPIGSMILIGPARLYVGDHWITDVLGAYLFGGSWLNFSLYMYIRLKSAFASEFDKFTI